MNRIPGNHTAKTPGKLMSGSSSMRKKKRGRPRVATNLSRPHRIVTFVTDEERVSLQKYCKEEDRSMAAAVHRIIKAHFEKRKESI